MFSQILLSDLLGHTGRIWDHLFNWAAKNRWASSPFALRHKTMLRYYHAWKNADRLTKLPPPP